MSLTVRPLTVDRWRDLEHLFDGRGCGMARECWCMHYRRSGRGDPLRPGEKARVRNRRELRELAAGHLPPGLIGYRGRTPVGWVSLGPREDFARLKRSPAMKPVDGQPVWSIICFVVPSACRRQGVAGELLAGSIEYARGRGVGLLEAYPVDTAVAPTSESLWFGTRTMFEEAGFEEVARRRPARPVMRLALGKSGAAAASAGERTG